MKDLISLIIYVFIFMACITLFIHLLPVLIIVLIIFLVMRYFKQNNPSKNIEEENLYQTSGNIKSDVIDVEYKETLQLNEDK